MKNNVLNKLFLIIICGCIGITSCTTTAPTEQPSVTPLATNAPTSTPTASATPTATLPPPTITATAEPTNTSTPIPTTTPVILPTATRPSYQISDTFNYMLAGLDSLWHPDNVQMSTSLPIYTGTHPWSPDGSQLAGWDSEAQSLAILTLKTGELDFLKNTSDWAWYGSPSWSPDGQYLLYVAPPENGNRYPPEYHIVLYNLNTMEEVILKKDVALVNLAGWSYDSTEIAYIYWTDYDLEGEAQLHIELYNVAEQTTRQINSPLVKFEEIVWSPVAKKLIAYSNPIDPYDNPSLSTYGFTGLYLIDVEADTIQPLPESNSRLPYNDTPHHHSQYYYYVSRTPWSPDGESVIYSDRGLICYTIIDSLQETCLTALYQDSIQLGAIGGNYPSWSSTGELIGFVLKFESEYCNPIAVVNADGSELRMTNMEAGDCSLFGPIWFPMQDD